MEIREWRYFCEADSMNSDETGETEMSYWKEAVGSRSFELSSTTNDVLSKS